MKKRVIPAAMAVALLAFTGCAGTSGSESEPANTETDTTELTKVKVAAVVATSSMPIVLAQEEGIFEKHGLEVELAETNSLPAITPALLSGEINFVVGAAPSFVIGVDQGLPLQAIAGTAATSESADDEGNRLLVPAGSDATSFSDLVGKKIAVNAVGGTPHVPFLATHVSAGGSVDDFEFVVMPMNEQLAALEANTIDGALLGEPYTTMAKLDGHTSLESVWRAPGHEILEAGEPYILVIAATPYIEENPDIAKAMRDALIEANEMAAANDDKIVDMLIQHANVDPDIAQDIFLPDFNGTLTGDELQRTADALELIGMLDNPFDGKAAVWQP